jgi:7-cyano-7-deazaguanine synthase
MAKDLAIVLNNGSVNSAVVTAMAAQRFRPVMVYVDATQQPGSRARAAYDMQVAHFKPYREHTLSMPYLAGLQGTIASGVNDPRMPMVTAAQMTHLLPIISSAIQFASHHQAAVIYLGWRVGSQPDDLSHATEYIQILNELVQMPCGMKDLDIMAPILELEPWQVVDTGFQVGAPFERTWSCLENTSDPCWACRGCRMREAAFMQAGKADPMRVVRKV